MKDWNTTAKGSTLWRGHPRCAFFILSRNPITSDFLHSAFNGQVTAANSTHRLTNAYFGYINIFFLGCAILTIRLLNEGSAPWLFTLLVFFALLRMGDHLTVNGQAHTSIALPERFLSDFLPAVFGAIGQPAYYQIGIVIPLAVLSCVRFIRTFALNEKQTRVAVVLLSITILSIECYLPRQGFVFEHEKTAYLNWLQSENESPIAVNQLAARQREATLTYYMYTQIIIRLSHRLWLGKS